MTKEEKNKITTALKSCLDPELGIDVVSLGLIYDITGRGKNVKITMTLTTPGCPLIPYFKQEIEQKVKSASEATKVDINLTFDPPWTPDKMSPDAKKQLAMLR